MYRKSNPLKACPYYIEHEDGSDECSVLTIVNCRYKKNCGFNPFYISSLRTRRQMEKLKNKREGYTGPYYLNGNIMGRLNSKHKTNIIIVNGRRIV